MTQLSQRIFRVNDPMDAEFSCWVIAAGPGAARQIAEPANPRLTVRDDTEHLLASDKHAASLQALLDGPESGVVGKQVRAYSPQELFGALAAGRDPSEGKPPPEWIFLGKTVPARTVGRPRGPGMSP